MFRFRLAPAWWARGADVGPATAAQRGGGDWPSGAQSPERTWAISRKGRMNCSCICSRPPFAHSGVNLQVIRKWGHAEREVKIKPYPPDTPSPPPPLASTSLHLLSATSGCSLYGLFLTQSWTSSGLDSEASAKKKKRFQSNHLVLREHDAELRETMVRPSGGGTFANCKCIMVEFEHNAKRRSRRNPRRPAGSRRALDSCPLERRQHLTHFNQFPPGPTIFARHLGSAHSCCGSLAFPGRPARETEY